MRTALYYLILIAGLLVTFFFIAYLVNNITTTIYEANLANVLDKSIVSSIEQESSSLYIVILGRPVPIACIEHAKILKIGKVSVELQYLERLFNVRVVLYCPHHLTSEYVVCSSKIDVLVVCLASRHYLVYVTCS